MQRPCAPRVATGPDRCLSKTIVVAKEPCWDESESDADSDSSSDEDEEDVETGASDPDARTIDSGNPFSEMRDDDKDEQARRRNRVDRSKPMPCES